MERLYLKLAVRYLRSCRLLSSAAATTSIDSVNPKVVPPEAAIDPKPFSSIPGPGRISMIGALRKLRSNEAEIRGYFDALADLQKIYGDLVKVEQGWGRGSVVHVFDPEDSKTVFNADGRQPHIVPLQETTQKYREMKKMNPGLGNLNGEEWYRLRSAVQQAMMRPQAVLQYLPFVNQVADDLVKHIKESLDPKEEADMRRIAGRWALEAAGLTVFEKRLGSFGENVKWADNLVDINREIFRLSAKLKFVAPFYKVVSTPKWRKMVGLEDAFYKEATKLINEAIEKLGNETGNEEEMFFASHLVNKKELTKKDISVIMLSLFSDGLSTTAPMLIYNLYNLAANKEIQQQVRDEVNKVAKPWEPFTPEKLTKLPFLKACIKETFRLFPIGTEISRISQVDLVLSGYKVPAGTPIDINTNVLMRSTRFFTDPNEFRPQRWLRSEGKPSQAHPFAFLPFGFGPRMCAGRRFAEQDLQVVLARLVSAFAIQHRYSPLTQVYETLLLPDGNCHFTFTPIY
ncbi:unnamed protein product, partial [Mesorhabditis belari]|uniref:Cytochrome P450 n=1 Tax=Mesorhabditis belari TaxID=2138241 RepID=A0AAF3EWV4_9BILA